MIPGHGRISDEHDVAMYRDMLTIIRDRIKALVAKKMTLDQVKAARPTLDYDGRYGAETGPWTTEMFIEAMYQDLSRSLPRSAERAMNTRTPRWLASRCALAIGRAPVHRCRRSTRRWTAAGAAPRSTGGPVRSHRHLGLDRHRRLAVADGDARRKAIPRACRSTTRGARPRCGGMRQQTRRRQPVQGVRRRRDHAAARSSAHLVAGRRHLKLEFDAGTQTRLLHFDRTRRCRRPIGPGRGFRLAQWEGPGVGRGPADDPRVAGGGLLDRGVPVAAARACAADRRPAAWRRSTAAGR